MAMARVTFKVTILTLFLVLTLILSAVVLSVNYQRNSSAALAAAQRLLEEEGDRVAATSQQLIDPLFNVINTGVMLPTVDATAPARGEHALAPVMFALLERWPQMTALYV